MRLTGDQIVRAAALAAVVVVAVVVAFLLLRSPGGGYTVKANFQNAAQLVKGNLVQTGGAPVGKVKDIDLTEDGQAEVTLNIQNDFAPLHRGTLATIRQASLSGVANRYVDLHMAPHGAAEIPDGGVIDQSATTTAVDLDQLFNTFDPQTRKALAGVIKGSAEQYKDKGKQFNEGIAYLNPSLAASSRLFRELNRDTPLLERFIVSSSQLVTDIADHHDDRDRRPGRGARRVDRPPARLRAPRQHDVRQPARRARRPRPAGRGLQAGGEEAAPVPRRAAP